MLQIAGEMREQQRNVACVGARRTARRRRRNVGARPQRTEEGALQLPAHLRDDAGLAEVRRHLAQEFHCVSWEWENDWTIISFARTVKCVLGFDTAAPIRAQQIYTIIMLMPKFFLSHTGWTIIFMDCVHLAFFILIRSRWC